MIRNFVLFVLMATMCSFAEKYDFFFRMDPASEGLCVAMTAMNHNKLDAEGKKCNSLLKSDNVRIRVVDPVADKSFMSGITLNRPFFILDGIYLSTDGVRTLSELEDEANRLGIMDVLVELGYTPVLVQFAETVRKPLLTNALTFAKLLQFINSNKIIGFANKLDDGMVVLGISQGGILGRFGAYTYDVQREKGKDAPIRLYASLDSPHQGAVLPLSLYYTVDFWAGPGGSADAEAFKDLIDGPGASELLVYQRKNGCDEGAGCHEVNMSNQRFLYGLYRKAAEYKGFPSVLVAQGQLKGESPKHSDTYFTLNRWAKKWGTVMGRAESEMYSTENPQKKMVKNRVYEKFGDDSKTELNSEVKFDFVQGSTYPFAETMYMSLRSGFKEAIPDDMKVKVLGAHIPVSTGWDKDTLVQKSSTFIPTASAMDMKCGGALAMKGDCAFKQSSADFPFANPGSRSSADAVYAVDPTHPRYKEKISGRHIELPEKKGGNESNPVVKGFQVDMWRILCELANHDYDSKTHNFRNENLVGSFKPETNCMDQSQMPLIIKNSANLQKKTFAYGKYDYLDKKASRNKWNTFDVPAGWHKVAIFDNGEEIPENSSFEVDLKVDKAKGNWMKAELILHKSKNENGQIQLKEIDVPLNGDRFVARWPLPKNKDVLASYRWFRLVLNSDGATVSVKEPRLVHSVVEEEVPKESLSKDIYPNLDYKTYTWTANTVVSPYSDALGSGLKTSFKYTGHGFHFDFGGMKNLEKYSSLKVEYWPGTCQKTAIYFDSFRDSRYSLENGNASGNFESKDIPLSKILDVSLTPQNKLAASRLSLQSKSADETCIVKSITLH